MTAVFMLNPMSFMPSWVLWLLIACSVVGLGIGPLASWRNTSRVSRGLVVAIVAASIFILVGFNCDAFGGWVPDWLCYAVI